MGFTLRFVLGAVLVLSCCWLSETTTPVQNGASQDERTTQRGVVANLTEETTKPKTDLSTEDNKPLDKQNSISKLQKSETYKKATNQPESKREDIARSIDIDKYVSKEFHNKNNVYTVSVSPDNEKYVDHDYSYHPTTRHDEDHTKEFHFDTDLTTPKSSLFDNKYREAVESVEQKLEHIDDSHDLSLESESKENLNLEKLYDETQNNDTKANLNYINYKNIVSNDTNGKNNAHKDLVVEAGTNLDFRSSYNETTIIDEDDNGNKTIAKEPTSDKTNPKGDQDRSESSTTKSVALTTRKSIVLTKPPSNKNTSHISILSNNIETETVKAINPTPSSSTTEKPKGERETVEEYTLRNPITIAKRGKTKFADTITSTSAPISNEIKKKKEQLFQENQLVPVHVEAPSTEKLIETTTVTSSESETTTNYPTDATTMEAGTEVSPTTVPLIETTPEIGTTTALPTEDTTIVTSTTISTATSTEKSTTAEDTTVAITTITPSSELLAVENTTDPTDLDNVTSTTTESTINVTSISSVTEIDEGTTIVPPVTTTIPITTKDDIDKNGTMTTENSMRTSKVFRETIPTTEPLITTTEMVPTTQPSTTEEIIATTVKTPETRIFEQPITTTTETNYYPVENRTNLIPEIRHETNNESTTEPENLTDENTVASDSFNTLPPDDNSGTIAAITISTIGAVCLILLAGLLIIMRKRQKRFNYPQRCTPVSLGHYSIDNVSTINSVRRKGEMRDSKRSYTNQAFEDPAAISHPLNLQALGNFVNNAEDMKAEFEEIPQVTTRTNELPDGCDVKNRYANVIPLPETRVPLSYIDGYPNSNYINANYVTGPKNVKGYYIACQAPMENTVDDFWRMVWEQQSQVILMLTHLYENGVEKCFDYLPPSEVLDCHRAFGDYLVTLKKREVKDKYIISTLQLKNMVSSSWREVTHFWYLGWPEKGVPSEANSLIAFLIEARSYMKSSSIDRKNVTNSNLTNGTAKNELNPVVVHCSPGTGRTGVVIACDIAIREFEQTRLVDIPRIVYKIRRGRASAVQTKDQYAYIYKVVHLYARKLTGDALDSF